MLRRIVLDGKPDYFAVVFDAPGKTFRDDWYPQYKANRTPMPDDLALQIEPLHELVRANGWSLLMIEGVEADDVIATLAKQAKQGGIDTVISTSDKDLAQLVEPGITLVNTMSNETLDEQGVMVKFGVRPDQVLDLLTLTGDAIDNVPGVAKVGPKTAAKWLNQYGTLDDVIAHAGEISGVVGENLRQALAWLPEGKRLLTVKTDCALPVKAVDLGLALPDATKVRELYTRFEFKAWLKDDEKPDVGAEIAAKAARDASGRRFDEPRGPEPTPSAPPIPTYYESVLDRAAFDRLLAEIKRAELVAIDVETTVLEPMEAQIVGLSFAIAPGRAFYVPVGHNYAGAPSQLDRDHVLACLTAWFADPARRKVGQNLKFDQHALD